MMERDEPDILILTDEKQKGETLADLLRRDMPQAKPRRMRFDQCASAAASDWLFAPEIVIVDLLRRYPGGMRAEGVALAKRRMQRHLPFLIVSPFFQPALRCHGYWDVSAADSFGDRVKKILGSPQLVELGFDDVLTCFESLLKLPRQHQESVAPSEMSLTIPA